MPDLHRLKEAWPADGQARSSLSASLLDGALTVEKAHRDGATDQEAAMLIQPADRGRIAAGLGLDAHGAHEQLRQNAAQTARMAQLLEQIQRPLERLADAEDRRAKALGQMAAVLSSVWDTARSKPVAGFVVISATMAMLRWWGVPLSEAWPFIRAMLVGLLGLG